RAAGVVDPRVQQHLLYQLRVTGQIGEPVAQPQLDQVAERRQGREVLQRAARQVQGVAGQREPARRPGDPPRAPGRVGLGLHTECAPWGGADGESREGVVVGRAGRGKGWSWEGLVVRKEWWREGVVAGRTTGRERVSGVRGSWAGGPTPGWPWVRDAGGCRGPGAGASVRPRSRRSGRSR